LGAVPAYAQETRADSIAEERAAKAQESPAASVQEPGLIRRTFTWASRQMDSAASAKDGFYPEFGGLVPGSGWPSLGPGYRHHLFGDAAVLDTSAAISWRRYSMIQSHVDWPKLFSNHLSAGAQVKYQDSTQINYFGVGADTDKSAQTDFRLKSVDVAGSATVRPREWLSVGGRVGYIRSLKVSPGLSPIHPTIAERFDETTAPGLADQPRYRHADAFVEANSLDVAGYPSRGGQYRIGLASFADLDGSGHSFRRMDADATHYLPLFHNNWVVAVRGRLAMSQTSAGNDVPFYLLPTLGGENTLRAYSDYRFRDRNLALLSAEYRWPVFRMLDAAIFADAGTVAATPGDLWRQRADRDYGVSVRLHSATSTIGRIDVSKGREGTRLFVSLSAPLGASSRNVIPYVP
jgi:hypothetical protein